MKKALSVILTLFLASLFLSGCASYAALVRSTVTKSYAIQNSDYDQAFTQIAVAAKDLKLKVVRQNKEKGTVYMYRGYGYAEFTNMEARIVKDPSGSLQINLVAKSSKNGDEIISEFLNAYNKYVQTK